MLRVGHSGSFVFVQPEVARLCRCNKICVLGFYSPLWKIVSAPLSISSSCYRLSCYEIKHYYCDFPLWKEYHLLFNFLTLEYYSSEKLDKIIYCFCVECVSTVYCWLIYHASTFRFSIWLLVIYSVHHS